MYKTLTYHCELSNIEVSLFKDKGKYSFCLMQIFRGGKHETLADGEEYVTVMVNEMLDSYIETKNNRVLKELGLKKSELKPKAAIELKQVINKVKNKLCKSKDK